MINLWMVSYLSGGCGPVQVLGHWVYSFERYVLSPALPTLSGSFPVCFPSVSSFPLPWLNCLDIMSQLQPKAMEPGDDGLKPWVKINSSSLSSVSQAFCPVIKNHRIHYKKSCLWWLVVKDNSDTIDVLGTWLYQLGWRTNISYSLIVSSMYKLAFQLPLQVVFQSLDTSWD